MDHSRAAIALLVDFANLRPDEREEAVQDSAASNGSPAAIPTESDLARSLVQFAGGAGRIGLARAYADWTRDPTGARALNGTRLEAVMVPATDDGEDRSHIRLVVDAMEAVFGSAGPDAFVLVSGDPTLVPLARALRAAGSEVIVVSPTEDGELPAEADSHFTLEQVLQGAEIPPVTARFQRGGRWKGKAPRDRSGRPDREERRPTAPIFDPGSGEEPDFSTYQWSHFVRLIDELEERLPFVGVRYLVNKVLGAHNCGIEDPRLKRDLLNVAVDEGILELYTVENVGDRLDPVTACRLDRQNGTVQETLGADTGRGVEDEGPSDLDGDDLDEEGFDGDGFDEGGLDEGDCEPLEEPSEHAGAAGQE